MKFRNLDICILPQEASLQAKIAHKDNEAASEEGMDLNRNIIGRSVLGQIRDAIDDASLERNRDNIVDDPAWLDDLMGQKAHATDYPGVILLEPVNDFHDEQALYGL